MKSHRLKEAVRAYVSYVKGRGLSESTVRAASNLFGGVSPWTASKDVREIGETDIRAFRKALDAHIVRRSGKPMKRSSKFQILATLKTFFRFLEREGWILLSPMKGIKLKRIQSIPKALSALKVEALITLQSPQTPIGQRNRALFEVLYGTGLRLSECERLDLSDIDLRQGTILVRSGKGRKDRYVPVTGRARDALQAYLMESRPLFAERRDCGALFLATGGGRLGSQSIRIMVKRAGRSLGVRVSPHVLRHSFATHLLDGGASIAHVQKLLGHQSIGTTEIYTRVETGALKRMVEKRHPRERPRRRRRPA